MEKITELGHNRTGVQMSPDFTEAQLEAAEAYPPDVSGDSGALAQAREEAFSQSDRIGSVPVPGSTKGKLKSGFDKMLGHQPELFVDKLGERLAFERTGVRLYDALLAKLSPENTDEDTRSQLQTIRNEELEHMQLVKQTIETLGADPTVMTPCANVAAVSSIGIMQVLTDPRTNLVQCLNAIMTIELTDNAAWDMLVDLADQAGHPNIAKDFTRALEQEDRHLEIITDLLKREMKKQA